MQVPGMNGHYNHDAALANNNYLKSCKMNKITSLNKIENEQLMLSIESFENLAGFGTPEDFRRFLLITMLAFHLLKLIIRIRLSSPLNIF